MLQRDYLLRMTEALVKALSKVLFLKEQKNFKEAKDEIEREGKLIAGVDIKMISLLNMSDIMMLMNANENSAGRFLVTAELLNQYSEITEEEGNSGKAADLYEKSLRLFLEAVLTRLIPQPEIYYSRISEILNKLEKDEYEITVASKERLASYYEQKGEFAEAENIVFEILEEGNLPYKEKALSFYKRLLLKPDEELIEGNLSREEVKESMEEIAKF